MDEKVYGCGIPCRIFDSGGGRHHCRPVRRRGSLVGGTRWKHRGTAVDVDALGGYSGNSLQDLSAQVSYAFDSVVDVGVELGYRRFALKLDDDAQTDVSLGGPYVAVALHLSP